MVLKSDFNLLQLEVKKLTKLKEGHSDMVNKYQNEIFPSVVENFYKYKLSLINTQMLNNKEIEMNSEIELNKHLYSVENSRLFLGSYYDIIFNFFILLRNQEKILVNIIKNINEEYQKTLIIYISLIYFENIFEIDDNNNELNSEELFINILEVLIEKELDKIINDDLTSNNYARFLNDTLASKIINNFIKFQDVQEYLKNIFSEIICDMLEMEHKNVFIEPNRIRDYLFPVQKIYEEIEEDNELDKYINYKKKMRATLNSKVKNNISMDNSKKLRQTLNNTKFKANNALKNSANRVETNSSAEFDKSFRETIVLKDYYTNVFFNENEITNSLYNDLTHSRLIYSLKEQKIFFNNNDENYLDIYKPINLDEFLKDKDKNPEVNYDYSKYDLSEKELKYRYINSGKYNKYMKQFYYNQYNELQKDKKLDYSNMSFLKSMKNNYQNIEAIIKQYKLNFEKLKYFIDKMIYKILKNKDEKIPFCIKRIINIIYNYFTKKGKKINQIEINGYIFEFFIGKIIIPFLTNEKLINMIVGKKIDKETKSFLFYFSKIIKKIFRSNFYNSFEKDFTIFNIYICEILPFINLIVKNFINNKNNNKIISKDDNSVFCKIKKHDSLIINETIIRFVIDYLTQNNNNKFKKLFESNPQLNQNFNLIIENYKNIIQQFEENNENNEFINNNSENNNIFGGPMIILIKEEFLKQNENKKITLSTSNEINQDNNDILSKIKFSLLKFLELVPSDFFNQNSGLIKNKSKIKILEDIKNIFTKNYINNNLIEKNIENPDNNLSITWYIDYFLKFNEELSEEYMLNDFEKLFVEIKTEIKNEVFKYQNDLTEYNFNLIINNSINSKLTLIKNTYQFYSQNKFSFLINDYIFNNFKENIEIHVYEKNERKYLFLNKLSNNDSEMVYVKNEIFNDIYIFIDYFSQHIIQENILSNFEEIEDKYKKKLSLIDNVNTFLEEFIMKLKDYVIKEIYPKKEENGGKTTEEEIINIDKDQIEKIISIIEQLINEEIYIRIWKNQKSKDDEELNELYNNKLSKKTPKDVGINPKYINEKIWENIILLMKTKYNINDFKTPMDKIKCIENIYKVIDKSLIVITNKKSDYSVDDIFPIFVYLLIQTKLQFLITNLNFIKLLIRKKNLIKSSGFALTQLEMAIQFLRNIE